MKKILKCKFLLRLTLKFIIFSFVFSSLYGCASISYRGKVDCERPPDYIYPATNIDVQMYGFFVFEGGFHVIKIPILVILAVPFLIDLPFSIATDTVLLPYDLYSKSNDRENRFFCREDYKRNQAPSSEYNKDREGNKDVSEREQK